MAQLIKLHDYISRYEWNIYKYPSQFIRLKQDNWNKLHELWRNPQSNDETEVTKEIEQISPSPFGKLKGLLRKDQANKIEEANLKKENELPETEDQLKQYFLDKLLRFQLKWASSTVTDVSLLNETYYKNETLKYFLQRFPDIYFLMYYPIFSIKNTPIDTEIILISPVGIELICLLEKDANQTIIVTDERTWRMQEYQEETKFLSPMIALNRTEKIVKSILSKHEIDFPVKKVVLSRTNSIIHQSEPYQTRIIGKREYAKWFEEKRSLTAPLKSRQLKVAEQLLNYCQSTALKRPEWDEDVTSLTMESELL